MAVKIYFLISSGGGGFGPSFGGSAASAGAQSFNGGGLGGGFSGSAANAQSQSFNGNTFFHFEIFFIWKSQIQLNLKMKNEEW